MSGGSGRRGDGRAPGTPRGPDSETSAAGAAACDTAAAAVSPREPRGRQHRTKSHTPAPPQPHLCRRSREKLHPQGWRGWNLPGSFLVRKTSPRGCGWNIAAAPAAAGARLPLGGRGPGRRLMRSTWEHAVSRELWKAQSDSWGGSGLRVQNRAHARARLGRTPRPLPSGGPPG